MTKTPVHSIEWELVDLVEIDNSELLKQKVIEFHNENMLMSIPKPSISLRITNKCKWLKEKWNLWIESLWIESYFYNLIRALRWDRTLSLIEEDFEFWLIYLVKWLVIDNNNKELRRIKDAIYHLTSPYEVEEPSDEEFDKMHAQHVQAIKVFYEELPLLKYNLY